MYVPQIFRPKSPKHIRQLIEANPFATLVGSGEGRMIAAHVPLLWVEEGAGRVFLEGHIAAGNELKYTLIRGEELLAIFQGPHAYVSSSWYTHENVPTWNYMAVHVYGKPEILEGEALYLHLRDMVNKYENGRNPRFSLETMNAKALAGQMKGIVGFRMEASRVEASFKLSQNRNATDHGRIIEQLENSGNPLDLAVAEAMKKHSSNQ